ncbi:MAG: hypothetical protein Kow00107_02110 [Planctomycetota bacterium]
MMLMAGCADPEPRGHLDYPLSPKVEDCLLRVGGVLDFEALYDSLASEPEADRHFWVGLVALSAGKSEECRKRMELALELGMSGVKRTVCKMSLGDVMFAKGDYSSAFQIYKPLLEEASGQVRYLLLARMAAAAHMNGDPNSANLHFYNWQNSYPVLTLGFPTAKSIADRLRSDLSSDELFALQAGYFTDRSLAESACERISSLGYEVSINSISGGYRVIVGPFKGREKALAASDALRAKGVDTFLKSWGSD